MSIDSYQQDTSTISQGIILRIPTLPSVKEIVPQFHKSDMKIYREYIATYGISSSSDIVSADITSALRKFVNELLKKLKERELEHLVALSYTIETDPDRLKRLREITNEAKYSCYVIWLVNRPFDALPDIYKEVEIELYRLGRYNSDIYVAILDSTRYPMVVTDLMRALEIDSLPALILSSDPIDLTKPRKENTIIFKSGALERLAQQGRLIHVISNIPNWARMKILRDKAKWEVEVKSLLSEVWEQIKSFVSLNI